MKTELREDLERALQRCGLAIHRETHRADRYVLTVMIPGLQTYCEVAFDGASVLAAGTTSSAGRLFEHELRFAQERLLALIQLNAVRGNLHPNIVFVDKGDWCPVCDGEQTIVTVEQRKKMFACDGRHGRREHAFPTITAVRRNGLLVVVDRTKETE